jgi:Na+-driven multidrug efflux pump
MVAIGTITQPLIEKITNETSLSYSQKDTDGMKANLMRGLYIFVLYFFLIFIPVTVYCDEILMFFGSDQVIAVRAKHITAWMFPFELCRLVAEAITSYMVSQSLEQSLGMLTVVPIALSIPTCYYFGYTLQMGVKGWLYGKAVLEVSKLVLVLLTYYFRVKDGSLGLNHVRLGFTKFGSFASDVAVYTAGYFTEAFGFQCSTVLVILIGDPLQISAYTALTNLKLLLGNIPFGFNSLIRARIIYLIGIGKTEIAKAFFKLSIVGLLLCSVVLGGLMIGTKGYIAYFFTSKNPAVGEYLEKLLFWLGVGFFELMIFIPLFSISRCVKQAILNLIIDFIFLLVFQIAAGLLLLKLFKSNCVHILLNLLFSLFIAEVIILIILLRKDWATLDETRKESIPLLTQKGTENYSGLGAEKFPKFDSM